jgi:WD40 repeat protein
VLEGHSGWVTSLAFTDGALFSGSIDKTVKKWSMATGTASFTSSVHDGWVSGLSPGVAGSNTLFSCSGDCSIVAWDTATGNPMAMMKGHKYSASAVKVTPDGSMYSAAWDGQIREWVIFDVAELPRDGAAFVTAAKSGQLGDGKSSKSTSKDIFEFESSVEEESDDEVEEGGKNDRPRIVDDDDDNTFLTSGGAGVKKPAIEVVSQSRGPRIEVVDDDSDEDLEGLE